MGKFFGGGDSSGEFAALSGQTAEIALHLDAIPEILGLAEKGTEADGHGGSDGALPEHDFIDGTGWHTDGTGHGILRDTHGLEIFFEQDFARGNRWVHGHIVVPRHLQEWNVGIMAAGRGGLAARGGW